MAHAPLTIQRRTGQPAAGDAVVVAALCPVPNPGAVNATKPADRLGPGCSRFKIGGCGSIGGHGIVDLRHGGGDVRGYIAIATDVTDQVTARAALAASEQRFRSAFESANVGMFMASLAPATFALIVQVNHAICTFLGVRASELVTRTLEQFCDPDDAGSILTALGEMASGDVDHVQREQRYRLADGTLPR